MSKTRILLTGADTFMGSHILAQLLSHDDVSVRAVLNTAEAVPALQSHYQRIFPSSVDFATVCECDFLVPGIFEDALRDSSEPFHAVVHTLSNESSDEADCLARFIKLQTDAIIGFLISVQEASRVVSRVVIVGSLIPFARWLGDPHTLRISDHVAPANSTYPIVDSEHILATSQASNNIVSDAVLTWAKQYGARFNIVFVTAPSVYGPAVHPLENSSELTETNRRIWNICSNEPLEQATRPPHGINQFSDVRDLADATFRALFSEQAANKRLVVSAGTMPSGVEIAQYLTARFPELQSRLSMEEPPSRRRQSSDPPLDFLDTYLMSTILNITQLRSAEITLDDTVRQMLDLQQRKAWRSVTQS